MEDCLFRSRTSGKSPQPVYIADCIRFERHIVSRQNAFHESGVLPTRVGSERNAFATAGRCANSSGNRRIAGIEWMHVHSIFLRTEWPHSQVPLTLPPGSSPIAS